MNELLMQALESLRRQTFKDFVVIVCDDASSENIEEVVGRFPDLRIEYHRNERNLGQFANTMRGLEYCTTPLLKFLHNDDLLFPTALEAQVVAMRAASDAAMCLGGALAFKQPTGTQLEIINYVQPYVPPPRVSGRWVDLENFRGFIPSACMFRTELLRREGGFNSGLAAIGDWEIYIALSAKYRLVSVDDPVCAYRIHDGQISNELFFESEEALLTRDIMWLTSSANPCRERLGLPRSQQLYLRLNMVWQNLRLCISLRGRTRLWKKWFRFVMENKILLPFIGCFPWFVLIKLFRKPKLQEKSQSDFDIPAYGRMIEGIASIV